MKLINWNVEWNTAKKSQSLLINEIIQSYHPDFVCLTESSNDFVISNCPNIIASEENYGYNAGKSRRKVILNSCNKFYNINQYGCIIDPGGRFVSGMTNINNLKYFVIGLCIPWYDAHVNTGNKNRVKWQDHRLFLENLESIVSNLKIKENVIILGDFNQRIPRKNQPEDIYIKLLEIFKNFNHGIDLIDKEYSDSVIDHVFVSKNLKITKIAVIKNIQNGKALSDHNGYYVEIENVV